MFLEVIVDEREESFHAANVPGSCLAGIVFSLNNLLIRLEVVQSLIHSLRGIDMSYRPKNKTLTSARNLQSNDLREFSRR